MRELEVLAGDWEVVSSLDGRVLARGRTTFTRDGELLRQESTTEVEFDAPAVWHENAPRTAQAVFGADDADGTITMLYGDSRGVRRVYRSAIEGDTWTIGRDAPGFNQRYRGTISADGDTVAGAYERSGDGVRWEKDFDLTYTRVSRPEPARAPARADDA
jgi:hypothetical protein